MKKYFIPFILFIAILVLGGSSVFAKTIAAAPLKVEYTLPYPGILPDHPLYVLKTLRDRILDVLIVDPVRKAEFYILQADKRLVMGVALVGNGKAQLAEQVISKGEKYMYNAVYGLVALKNSGKSVPSYLVDRLEKSMIKHAEVLGELLAKTTDPYKAGLTGSLELIKKLQGELLKVK